MTLLYCTSFNGYRVGGERTDLDLNWTFPVNVDPTNAGVFSPGYGTGRAAFLHEPDSQVAQMTLAQSVFLPFHETWVVGVRFRIASPQLEDPPPDRLGQVVGFIGDLGFEQFRIIARAGTLYVRMGNGTIGAVADVSILAGVWHYLEVKAIFHPSSGAAEIRVDEQTVFNGFLGNTKGTGNDHNTAHTFVFAGAHEARVEVSDIYIADGADATATQGRPYNHFLGDIGGKRLTPAGNGSLGQFMGSDGNFTDNYQLVDDDPPDADDTYVESEALTATDLYTFTPLSAGETPETIEAVVVESQSLAFPESGREQAHVVKSGGTSEESVAFEPDETYRWHQTVHTQDPDAGDRWSVAAVDAIEAGPKVVA